MGFWSFVGKAVITTTVGIALGPAAIPVGAAVWGGSEVIRRNCDDEDVKEAFGFISDCGRDTLTGGAFGLACQGAGAAIGLSETVGLGSNAASSAARKAAGEYFTVDGMKILYTSAEKARYIALMRHGAGVFGDIEFLVSKGIEVADLLKHKSHREDGIGYKSGCKVCEA